MVSSFRRQTQPAHSFTARLEGIDQRVEIDACVLSYVFGFRQISVRAKEAGGQLFGTIAPELVHIIKATGPYPGDERSRCRYRSNPAAAQDAIREQSLAGLLYLGEWHTHAEDSPSASGSDKNTMRLILQRSRLNSNALLLLIIGRKAQVDGIGLWSIAAGCVHHWTLETVFSI